MPVLKRTLAEPRREEAVNVTPSALARLSIVSYVAILAVVTSCALAQTDGTLIYTLDDPYIHLATAKTWIEHGAVGVVPGPFTMSSSSPAWTAILIGVGRLVGLVEISPFVLNVVFSVASLWAFWWAVDVALLNAAFRSAARWKALALALPVVLLLPSLTLAGMEHSLHIAATLLFAGHLLVQLERPRQVRPTALTALAVALPLIRLESVALVCVASGLLFLRGLRRQAAVTAALCLLPNLAIGAYSMSQGGFFLPNSVVLKSFSPGTLPFPFHFLVRPFWVFIDPLLLGSLIAAAATLRGAPRSATALRALLTLSLATAAAHLFFARIGWSDRYQAYLLALLWLAICRRFRCAGEPPRLADLALPLWARRGAAALLWLGAMMKAQLVARSPLDSKSIHDQQHQVSLFVRSHYAGRGVAVNDLGAVALRSKGQVLDLMGIGNNSVLRRIRGVSGVGKLRLEDVESELNASGVELVVIYPDWFSPELWNQWYPVASWEIRSFLGSRSEVVFFARTREGRRDAYGRLRSFERSLPRGVAVRYETF